jgi:hypothetical protein
MYIDSPKNSFVRDGVLYIKPTLTADAIGENTMKHGSIDLGPKCTDSANWGCKRDAGASGNYINPIQSANI